MSYYDEKISIEGILWKLKTTFTGTKKWKKCWVTMLIKEKKRKDDMNSDPNLPHSFHPNTKIRLYQWSEAYKPSIMSGKKPKYTLDIKDCSLADYPLHPYSFVLTERASKTTLILACEDPNLHNQWMKCIDEAFSIMKTIIENQNEDEDDENNKSILLRNKSKALPNDTISIDHHSVIESLEHSIEQRMPSIAEEDLEEDISNCNLVYKYFRKKNIFEKEKENPYIEIEEDLEYLIYEIDSSIDREVMIQFIKLDLNLLSENIISYNEFHTWWKANANHLGLPLSPIIPPLVFLVGGGIAGGSVEDTAVMEEIVVKPKILLDQNHIDTIHLLGFIDNSTIHSNMMQQSYRNNDLLHMSLITDCPEISSRYIEKYGSSASFSSQYDEYTDQDCGWNQAYQSYLTSLAHIKIPREEVLLVADKIDYTNEFDNNINVEGEEGYDNMSSNNELNHIDKEYYDEEKEMNINELQVEAPTSTNISQVISPSHTNNITNKNKTLTSQTPLTHYRNSNSSKSQELKKMSPLFTTLINFNHCKGNFYDTVLEDVNQIIDDYCLPNQLKRIKLSNKSTKDNDIYESSGLIYYIIDCSSKEDGYLPTEEYLDRIHSYDEIKRKMASNEFRNTCYVANVLKKEDSHHEQQEIKSRISIACTMLSFIVDYAGFRVVAVSPVPLEQNSLVFGCQTKTSTGYPSDIFINTLDSISEQSTVIPDLAKQLNLQVYERSYRVSRTDEQKMNIITNDLQLQRSIDGRLYITNVASLLPVDFPRPNSFDVYTKQLRPEYIAQSNYTFYADLLQTNRSVHDNTNNNNNTNELFKLPLDEDLWSKAIANNLTCNTTLYQQLLPRLAHSLDSCSVMLLDSYGFTEWLHSNGVNCRHIGMLLSFCTSNVAKLLLLSEAIARCCKSILNSKLRTITRKYYADNLRATHRKQSKTEHYLEVKEHLMLTRKEIILNIFNLVLGCGDLRDEFWNGPLHDALYYKFGIEATSFYLLSQMHFPQLFIAMQYHLGTRFNDNAVYNMNVPGIIYPFTLQNIHEYLIPTAPSLTTSATIPGPVGNIPSFINSYILHGLYEHASKTLELQYVIESSLTLYKLYDTINNSNDNESIKIPFTYQYSIAHTLYKLVLSYYLSQDYLSALKYSRTYLSIYPHYHPITGRMLSLLMCIEWNLGNVEKAQLYFDATQEIYNYTLGANHPILIYHIHCFSSLYMSLPNKKGYSQGKLLLLLAYIKSKQSLSENHIITATYQVIVAEIYMNEMKHKSAIELLVNSSNVFINSQNIMNCQVFMKDSIRSLYNLSVCYHSIGNYPKAKDVLISCVSIYNFDIDYINDNINYIHLSALLLLSDVYLQSNEIDESLNSLYKGWYVMCDINKYTSKYKRNLTEKIMSNLVKKSFSLLLNSLNMSTKSLFESIVDEWMQQQSLQYLDIQDQQVTNNNTTNILDNSNNTNILDNSNNTTTNILDNSNNTNINMIDNNTIMKGLDIESQKVLLKMIWELGPFQYFELIIDGIEKHELAPIEEDDTITNNDINNNNNNNNNVVSTTLISLPAQAAFILSLTKNEINIFNHNKQAKVIEDIDMNKEYDML